MPPKALPHLSPGNPHWEVSGAACWRSLRPDFLPTVSLGFTNTVATHLLRETSRPIRGRKHVLLWGLSRDAVLRSLDRCCPRPVSSWLRVASLKAQGLDLQDQRCVSFGSAAPSPSYSFPPMRELLCRPDLGLWEGCWALPPHLHVLSVAPLLAGGARPALVDLP